MNLTKPVRLKLLLVTMVLLAVGSVLVHMLIGENLFVLPIGSDLMLENYLLERCRKLSENRDANVTKELASAESLRRRQARLRQSYSLALGQLPNRTPLNAQLTGTVIRNGYRIEKVVFESRPEHHITGNLYLPDGHGRCPGVLVLCGHGVAGKAGRQEVAITLVRNGLAAFVIDSVCQGERRQLARNHPAVRIGRDVFAHAMLDAGAKSVGTSLAGWMLWDNIRAIDYLMSRPDIDSEKLACTGSSGGGSQTAFLMAMDDRIAGGAPSCFITKKQRLFETLGPQDGCQNVVNEGLLGLEHSDLLTLRAPKPTLILAARHDFFDYDGTVETFHEAKIAYEALGAVDGIEMSVSSGKHGFDSEQRKAMVQWMCHHLLGEEPAVEAIENELLSSKQLQVTQSGQVISEYPNEHTVMDGNVAVAKALAASRQEFWETQTIVSQRSRLWELLGLRKQNASIAVEKLSALNRRDCLIEKLIIRRPDNIPIPALLFQPRRESSARRGVLYVDGRGKHTESGKTGAIMQLLREGCVVLAIDIRGCGELANVAEEKVLGTESQALSSTYRNSTMALHIGRPLPGQRVSDVLSGIEALLDRGEFGGERIEIVGIGSAVPAVLHAAFLDDRIAKVTLKGTIQSWNGIITEPQSPDDLQHIVPGALAYYDLPDLIKGIELNGGSVERVTDISPNSKMIHSTYRREETP